MAKKTATILGVLFLIAGVGGFVMPGMAGFHLSIVHSIVHLVSGALSLYLGLKGSDAGARTFCLIFGIVYGLLGVVGFLMGSPGSPSSGMPGPTDERLFKVLPGILELGTVDHMFHIVVGAIYVTSALMTRSDVLVRPGPEGTKRGVGL
jgi:hypothetical protein